MVLAEGHADRDLHRPARERDLAAVRVLTIVFGRYTGLA
jgi:hypothetical protein